MAVLNLNPSATAVDGSLGREGVNESWATIVAGAGNTASYTPTTGYSMLIQADTVSDQWTALRRMVFMFDTATAGFPTGSLVTGVNLKLYCNAIGASNFSSSFVLGNAPTTNTTSLITADYALLNAGKVEYSDSRVALSALSAGAYFTFALNTTALTALQAAYDASGVFKTGLYFDWDFDATSPTWASGLADNITVMCVEAGSTKWPILETTYYVGGGNATLSLTCTKASAGDTCDADLWAVEVFSGT